VKPFFRFAAVAAFIGSGMAQAADLTVEVAGLKDAKGKVLIAVYDRADNFLKQPVRTAAIDAQQGKVRVVIANLPSGDYALGVFQDRNGNGKLDTNPVGMPIEPYGFSNDAMGSFGPPSFEQSLMHLPEAGGLATINLR
jgi:uncharacterized protein (DUF2141 family)